MGKKTHDIREQDDSTLRYDKSTLRARSMVHRYTDIHYYKYKQSKINCGFSV